MSAASLSAAPSLNTLPERAFTLYCDGLRSPAIAQHLGVPERTVRYWIAKIRDDLAAADTAHLREEFVRAVEHLHQISAAAWQAFERELNQPPYQAPTGRKDPAASNAPGAPDASDLSDAPPAAPTITNPRHGPRYLRLALDAQRQISRIFGHYDHLRTQTSNANPNLDPTPAHILAPLPDSHDESEIPAKTAMAIPAESEIPAKTATAISPLPASVGAGFPPERSLLREEAGLLPVAPAGGQVPIPAKTATAPDVAAFSPSSSSALNPPWSPFSSVASVLNPRPLPAKTATPSGFPLLVGEGLGVRFPASIPLHWRM